MNPLNAGRTPNARNVYREQYMSSLLLDISNQNKTLNANKLQKSTGSSGAPPGDARTVTERYQDTDRLKVEVRQQLKEITDPQAAQDIVYELTTEELNFLAGQIPFVISDLKPKFKLGVPAEIFIPYLRKLMRKFVETEGVEYGLQQAPPAGGGGGPGGGLPPPTLNNMPPGPGAPGGLGGGPGMGPGAPGLGGILAGIPLEDLSRSTAAVVRRTEQRLQLLAANYPTVEDQQVIAACPNPYTRGEYYDEFQRFADNYPTAQQIGEMGQSIETAKMIGGKTLMLRALQPVVDVITNIDQRPIYSMKGIVERAKRETEQAARETEMDRMNEYDEVDAEELAGYFGAISAAPSNPLREVFNVLEEEQSVNLASEGPLRRPFETLEEADRQRFGPIFDRIVILEDQFGLQSAADMSVSDRIDQLEIVSGVGDNISLPPLERIQLIESDVESSGDLWQPGDPIPLEEQSFVESIASGPRSIGAQSAQSSLLELPEGSAQEGDIAVISIFDFRNLLTRQMKIQYLELIMKNGFEREGALDELLQDVADKGEAMLFLTCFLVDGTTIDPTATDKELSDIYDFLLTRQDIVDLNIGDVLFSQEEIPAGVPQALIDQVSPEKKQPLPELMTREQLSASKKGKEATPQGIADLELTGRTSVEDITPTRPSGNGLSRGCGMNCGCGKCKKMVLGKMKKGRGKNILIGRGLAVPTPTQKVTPSNIDFSKGIKPEPAYVPFGKHLINKWRLNDDVVMIRTPKGGAITNIPTQRVSRNLSKVLKTFVGGAVPDFESLNSLSENDKDILSTIAKTSRLSHSVPNPNKSKQEQEDTEFEILRGQIASGQDNKDAVKKFKLLLVKMMNQKRIPKGQGMEILTELAVLGH